MNGGRRLIEAPGVYFPKDLSFEQNWKPFSGDFFEIAPGISMIHCPGHIPGLCAMQVNMPNFGTWLCTVHRAVFKR